MVEWIAMKDLFIIKNGYTPSKNHQEYWEGGTIPWFRMEDIRQNGTILKDSIQHITPLGVKKGGLFPANSIIVATTATIGEHALIIVDSLANQQFTFLTKCKSYDSKLNMKFMYYYMFIVDEWCKKNTNVSGFASVDMDKFKKLLIPIPSLVEQERIVGILDTFTASIDNLKEQITQRRKQYACLIDECFGENYKTMMDKAEAGEILVEPLSKHGTFTRGRRFVRTDIVDEGQPCIHYGDMYTYYGLCADKAKTHLPSDFPKKMRYAEKGDVVIVGAGENNEDIGVGLVWLSEQPAAVHDACYIYKSDLNPMYVSYFLRSGIYHLQIKSNVVRGKICSISSEGIGRALIPIYTLERQERIVQKLYPFEALLSNLEKQLALRQKQYEYYLNKLLTFD